MSWNNLLCVLCASRRAIQNKRSISVASVLKSFDLEFPETLRTTRKTFMGLEESPDDQYKGMSDHNRLNAITEAIIGAAIEVHRQLGPGLLESVYEACLAHELQEKGIFVEQQKAMPLVYKTVKLECGYRMDLLVEKMVVVEVKSVEALATVHEAQTLSYLRLSGCKVGLLINFHVPLLKNGIRRFINGHT